MECQSQVVHIDDVTIVTHAEILKRRLTDGEANEAHRAISKARVHAARMGGAESTMTYVACYETLETSRKGMKFQTRFWFYHSFPRTLPSRGSTARVHVTLLILPERVRTLPSARATFIPPV